MTKQYDFSIIQLAPGLGRGERLNVAIIVFCVDNLDIRISSRLDKIKALSAAINVDSLRSLIENFSKLDNISRKNGFSNTNDRIAQLNGIGPIAFSNMGSFVSHSSTDYEMRLAKIMSILVEPEPAQLRFKAKRTRLLSVIKSNFRDIRILAKKGEGLDSHRIVEHHKLAEGLVADLALKNGAMHVMETVDFSSNDISIKKAISEIAISALILEQARMSYGVQETRSKLVYDASSNLESLIAPSLEVARNQGTDIINWASQSERNSFIKSLEEVAIAFDGPKNQKSSRFNAFTQPKLYLN